MKNSKLWSTLVLVAASLGSAAATASTEELTFAYPDVEPTGFMNAQGKVDGYFFKLMKAAVEHAGYKNAKYVVNPIPRVYAGLNDGRVDLTISFTSPAVQACCIFGDYSLLPEDLRVFYMNDTKAVSSKADLGGKSVIKFAGYTYGGAFDDLKAGENGTRFELANSVKAGVAMLQLRRADYLLGYARPVNNAISALNVKGVASLAVQRLNYVLVVSKKNPNAQDILKNVEASIKHLQKTAEFKQPALK